MKRPKKHIVFATQKQKELVDYNTRYSFSRFNSPLAPHESKSLQRKKLKQYRFACADPDIGLNCQHLDRFINSNINKEFNLKEKMMQRMNETHQTTTLVERSGASANF